MIVRISPCAIHPHLSFSPDGWKMRCIFRTRTSVVCNHTGSLCLLYTPGWRCLCAQPFSMYITACAALRDSSSARVCVCARGSVHERRHMCVARHPYDKWLPGWLKRTLSLHNEHRRSIRHCLWGKPGTSAAKVSVIPRNSTNVD